MFFFAQDRSYFEHKLKAGSLCQACFWILQCPSVCVEAQSPDLFTIPSDLPLFANLSLLSLLSCFRFVMFLVWFGFFRLAPSLLRCFALRVFVIFFAWLCRCFPWACLFASFDCDSSLYWPSYLLLPIAWPLLCFQVNDASQYVIMGIDNKLNILRFGQTCPCLKP